MVWDAFLMQGFERADRQFLDAAALAGHLVPEGPRAGKGSADRVGDGQPRPLPEGLIQHLPRTTPHPRR
jgi:hypothetical protein